MKITDASKKYLHFRLKVALLYSERGTLTSQKSHFYMMKVIVFIQKSGAFYAWRTPFQRVFCVFQLHTFPYYTFKGLFISILMLHTVFSVFSASGF